MIFTRCHYCRFADAMRARRDARYDAANINDAMALPTAVKRLCRRHVAARRALMIT